MCFPTSLRTDRWIWPRHSQFPLFFSPGWWGHSVTDLSCGRHIHFFTAALQLTSADMLCFVALFCLKPEKKITILKKSRPRLWRMSRSIVGGKRRGKLRERQTKPKKQQLKSIHHNTTSGQLSISQCYDAQVCNWVMLLGGEKKLLFEWESCWWHISRSLQT